MTITSDLQEMTDHSGDVSDHDCLGAIYGAEKPVYAGSGWTDMRDQVAREPGDNNAHWVEQTAVLYPSAEQAHSFFRESQLQWENCAGQSISVKEAGSTSLWQLDDVKAEDILISQMSTQKDAGVGVPARPLGGVQSDGRGLCVRVQHPRRSCHHGQQNDRERH